MEEKVQAEIWRLLHQHVPPLTTQQVQDLTTEIGHLFKEVLKTEKELAERLFKEVKTEKQVSRKK